MDDLQLYIYIALAAIYFLSRAFKGKKPGQRPGKIPDSNPIDNKSEDPAPREQPMTFEDLLKEFSGHKKEKELEKFEEEEVDDINEYEKELTSQHVEEPSYKTYNDPENSNFDDIYQGQGKYKTIDEQVIIEEPVKERFNEYKIHVVKNANYASRIRRILHSKESIKEAIILKEVLDRKYF